jgi:tRNA(fMet)-specific endonuclease VapC
VSATIVSFEEQMRGWMSRLAKKPEMADQIESYGRLLRQLRNYCKVPVIAFEETAAIEFQRLRKANLRIATMDLKLRQLPWLAMLPFGRAILAISGAYHG